MSHADKCRTTNDNEWDHCNACGGRRHEPDCTTRKQRGRDCLEQHTPAELEAAGYGPATQFTTEAR